MSIKVQTLEQIDDQDEKVLSEVTYKRRIRIDAGPNELCGYLLIIRDADTGEPITGIKTVVLHLDTGELNVAEVTYRKKDEQGKDIWETDPNDAHHRYPTLETGISANPEVSLTAFEKEKNDDNIVL